MVSSPRASIDKIARMGGIAPLNNAKRDGVVEKMSLEWSLKNIDPFHFKATTPFSPPDAQLASKSNL